MYSKTFPAGSYTVVANYIGAEPVSFTIAVPEDGRVIQNFALGQSGSNILVIGQSASQASALSRKRAADGVSDVSPVMRLASSQTKMSQKAFAACPVLTFSTIRAKAGLLRFAASIRISIRLQSTASVSLRPKGISGRLRSM